MQIGQKLLIAGLSLAAQVAVGQTVSVGATSSSTSGTVTTVTIPVTVATPAITTPTGSSSSNLAVLDVTAGAGDGASGIQTIGQSFMTINLNNIVIDSANGWNAQTSTYTAPVAGTYLLTTKMRLVDGTVAGLNYGLGAGTSNSDGAYFLWTSTSSGMRNGAMNTRLMKLNKGDQVHMFSYVDFGTGARLNSAELIIEQVQ